MKHDPIKFCHLNKIPSHHNFCLHYTCHSQFVSWREILTQLSLILGTPATYTHFLLSQSIHTQWHIQWILLSKVPKRSFSFIKGGRVILPLLTLGGIAFLINYFYGRPTRISRSVKNLKVKSSAEIKCIPIDMKMLRNIRQLSLSLFDLYDSDILNISLLLGACPLLQYLNLTVGYPYSFLYEVRELQIDGIKKMQRLQFFFFFFFFNTSIF
ncbi:uncharacterized protein LOC132029392 isoform X2 [Lycium ferocissimum]|uniref:uncharacterized protein LOC132029392 isoform X2 n=1 Tax=Lycium ferocissimum TaxID=112874 RepID=UPI00281570DA|nr:uncharacterized protein LOC132029392 isoform X2 [Lycium ferocissimum]